MKSQHTPTTINEYIAGLPGEVQQKMERIRSAIRKVVPEAEETISYQIPTFRLNKKNLIHFAAFQHHIGLYPGAFAVQSFKKDLLPFETSKGTIRFPLSDPMPLELIRRIVQFTVQENEARKFKTK